MSNVRRGGSPVSVGRSSTPSSPPGRRPQSSSSSSLSSLRRSREDITEGTVTHAIHSAVATQQRPTTPTGSPNHRPRSGGPSIPREQQPNASLPEFVDSAKQEVDMANQQQRRVPHYQHPAQRVEMLKEQLQKSDRDIISEYNSVKDAQRQQRGYTPMNYEGRRRESSTERNSPHRANRRSPTPTSSTNRPGSRLRSSPTPPLHGHPRATTADPTLEARRQSAHFSTASLGSRQSSQQLGSQSGGSRQVSSYLDEDSPTAMSRPATTELSQKPLVFGGSRRTLSPIAATQSKPAAHAPSLSVPVSHATQRPSSAVSMFGTRAFLQRHNSPSRAAAVPSAVSTDPGVNDVTTPMLMRGMETRTFSTGTVNESIHTEPGVGSPGMGSIVPTTMSVQEELVATAAAPGSTTPPSQRQSAQHHNRHLVDINSPHLSKKQKQLMEYYSDRCHAHDAPVNSGVLFVLSTCVGEVEGSERLEGQGCIIQDDEGYFYDTRLLGNDNDEVAEEIGVPGFVEVKLDNNTADFDEAAGFVPSPDHTHSAVGTRIQESGASSRTATPTGTPRRTASSGTLIQRKASGSGLLTPKRTHSANQLLSPTNGGGMGERQSSTASYAFSTPSNSTLFFSSPPKSPAHFSSFVYVQDANFAMNCLGPKGVIPLFDVLRRCPNLARLSLRGNNLDNQSVATLVNEVLTLMAKDPTTKKPRRRLMRHRYLRSLDLSDNPIGMLAGRAIGMMMDIGKNDLTPHPPNATEKEKKAHRGQEQIDEHFVCKIEELGLEDTLLNNALVKRLHNRALANKLREEGGSLNNRPWPLLLDDEKANANVEQQGAAPDEAPQQATDEKKRREAEEQKKAKEAAVKKAKEEQAAKEAAKKKEATGAKPVRAATSGFVLYWEMIF